MFPTNSQTITKIISSSSSEILSNGDYYIYSTHLVSDNFSNVNLYCGANVISVNGGVDRTDETRMNYHCVGNVNAENAGGSQGFVSLTYSSSTNGIVGINNGFTSGEIVITFFLFIILLFSIFQFFVFKWLGIKFHKQV